MVPSISVLMSAYNSEKFISQAIESILNQSFSDFELVVINDGSTDKTKKILENYKKEDKRIKVYHQNNLGIAKTRNRLIEAASAPYISWMDSDDISLATRLELQFSLLESAPEIVALGTGTELIDEDGAPICFWPAPKTHEEIDSWHMSGRGGAIIFSSSTMRKKTLIDVGGFDENLTGAEDLSLFLKLAEVGELRNLNNTLLLYRQHIRSISHTHKEKIRSDTEKVIRAAEDRRGVVHKPLGFSDLVPKNSDTYTKWGWWALKGKNKKTARKYAYKSVKANPWTIDSWKLLACAIRGY